MYFVKKLEFLYSITKTFTFFLNVYVIWTILQHKFQPIIHSILVHQTVHDGHKIVNQIVSLFWIQCGVVHRLLQKKSSYISPMINYSFLKMLGIVKRRNCYGNHIYQQYGSISYKADKGIVYMVTSYTREIRKFCQLFVPVTLQRSW